MSIEAGDRAIALIDPVSSGVLLKPYVGRLGLKLIAVFTVSDDVLRRAGKHLPADVKRATCDLVIEEADPERCESRLLEEARARGFRVVAVVPASEPGVELADRLASRLGVRGNDPSTSLLRRSKTHMREACEAAGILGPPFARCASFHDVEAFVRAHGWPTVLKTPKGAGAHHVFVCRTLDEARGAFDAVSSGTDVFGERPTHVLAEGFVPGDQYAVELFGHGDGPSFVSAWRVRFTDAERAKGTFDLIDLVSSDDDLVALAPVIDHAKRVAKAVGISVGPALVELRIDGPNVGLIEVGARLSGIDMPLLVRECTSFDPFEATLRAYLEPGFRPAQARFRKHGCIVMCPLRRTGRVTAIVGLDDVRRLPSYVAHKLNLSVGDVVRASDDLASTPLYVYMANASRQELLRDVEGAKRLFRIELE